MYKDLMLYVGWVNTSSMWYLWRWEGLGILPLGIIPQKPFIIIYKRFMLKITSIWTKEGMYLNKGWNLSYPYITRRTWKTILKIGSVLCDSLFSETIAHIQASMIVMSTAFIGCYDDYICYCEIFNISNILNSFKANIFFIWKKIN